MFTGMSFGQITGWQSALVLSAQELSAARAPVFPIVFWPDGKNVLQIVAFIPCHVSPL